MANIADYLNWRGDLSFLTDGFNEVDALIFACLSYLMLPPYIRFEAEYSFKEFADAFFDQPDIDERCIYKNDYLLLENALKTERFSACRMFGYRDVLMEDRHAQFSAESWRLPDGTLVLAFRGTDRTITGWREDFNMSFQTVVPAQQMALQYAREILQAHPGNAVFTGHSKGGNLAVFAAMGLEDSLQERITAVYNMDGPGFEAQLLDTPGYGAVLPKIRTIIPQSSVVGLLLDRVEEPIIIHSDALGIMQHDLHSWQVMGTHFVRRESLTADSVFLRDAVHRWLEAMDDSEKSQFVTELFGAVEAGQAKNTADLIKPKSVYKFLRTLSSDEDSRRVIAAELQNLVRAALHDKNGD